MELRVLRYVIALAEEEHFGRAAARAHVAQSALSHQVKQLERQLGVVLFDRSTRHVAITREGTRFLDHARGIVAAADRAAGDMALLAAGRAGAVSIGFVGTATYDVLPRVAQWVRAELPDVDLTLRGELLNPALLDGVQDGRFDLALVRPGPDGHEALDLVHLRTERLVAVLPQTHPLAGRARIRLSDLASETFVVHPSTDRSSMHGHVLQACRRAGFTPHTVVEVGETATVAVFVAAGIGVALVPEPVRSLRLDGVAYVDLVRPPTVDLALAVSPTATSPAVRRVAEVVLAVTTPAVDTPDRRRADRAQGAHTTNERNPMGLADKAKNTAEDVKGKGKEATGEATNDDSLKAEGKTDQTKSSVKQAGENVKDAFKS